MMGAPEVRPEIVEFYTSAYDEAGRLSSKAPGVLEFVRTRVAAAAISRHAGLLDLAATNRLGLESTMRAVLSTGRHDRALGFTTAYFHTAEELGSELAEAGFADVRLYGVEGPTWPVLKGLEAHTGESLTGSALLDSALTAARLTETDPAMIASSSHILAIGHTP
ncbi:MAG: hypothetical protein GEV11_07805 [Streptosporangiales bacterium]|nr:hypothetical protein [Streptosporangiales bacterium]